MSLVGAIMLGLLCISPFLVISLNLLWVLLSAYEDNCNDVKGDDGK